MIASPCNKICVIDPGTGLCRGCHRTLDEIARWGTMQDAERMRVWRELPARGETSGPGPAQAGARGERPGDVS